MLIDAPPTPVVVAEAKPARLISNLGKDAYIMILSIVGVGGTARQEL